MSRASETILEELHNEIATTLKDEIAAYRNGDYDKKDEEGVVITQVPVPASLIAQAIKYLKDNGVDRPEDEEPDPEDLLADELPSFGED